MNGPPPWLRVTASSLAFLHNKPSYDLLTAFYHIDLTSQQFVKKAIIYPGECSTYFIVHVLCFILNERNIC